MKHIVKMEFGSRVYGTDLPTSDHDYKFLFVPSAQDLVMQRAAKNVQENVKLSDGAQNTAGDIDCEGFSIQEFLKHLTNGQTLAVDMLFTPVHYIERDSGLQWVWDEIQANKDKLLCKRVQAFVGYCKAQANRYSLKGERVWAVNLVVEKLQFCNSVNPGQTLGDIAADLTLWVDRPSLVFLTNVENPRTGHSETYLEVCGRKFQLNKSLWESYQQAVTIQKDYGRRAQNAAANNGADTKALYHAVRVAREAEELLLTGHVTFPRPEADLLLKIRKSEITPAEISDIIDESLIRVENALEKSTLRDEPDAKFVEELVHEIHQREILSAIPPSQR